MAMGSVVWPNESVPMEIVSMVLRMGFIQMCAWSHMKDVWSRRSNTELKDDWEAVFCGRVRCWPVSCDMKQHTPKIHSERVLSRRAAQSAFCPSSLFDLFNVFSHLLSSDPLQRTTVNTEVFVRTSVLIKWSKSTTFTILKVSYVWLSSMIEKEQSQ